LPRARRRPSTMRCAGHHPEKAAASSARAGPHCCRPTLNKSSLRSVQRKPPGLTIDHPTAERSRAPQFRAAGHRPPPAGGGLTRCQHRPVHGSKRFRRSVHRQVTTPSPSDASAAAALLPSWPSGRSPEIRMQLRNDPGPPGCCALGSPRCSQAKLQQPCGPTPVQQSRASQRNSRMPDWFRSGWNPGRSRGRGSTAERCGQAERRPRAPGKAWKTTHQHHPQGQGRHQRPQETRWRRLIAMRSHGPAQAGQPTGLSAWPKGRTQQHPLHHKLRRITHQKQSQRPGATPEPPSWESTTSPCRKQLSSSANLAKPPGPPHGGLIAHSGVSQHQPDDETPQQTTAAQRAQL